MKILLFADLHLDNHQPFHTILPSGRNSRLQDGLNVLSEICEYTAWNDIDYVIFAGDLFENWRTLDVDVLNGACLEISQIREACNDLYLLVGNHDQYSNSGDIITIIPFNYYCKIIDRPATINLKDVRVFFIPFQYDLNKFKQACDNMEICADLMIFHQPIKEAILPGSNLPLNKGVSLSDLCSEKFKLCIGGDIHKRQMLGDNVYYLGSPMQLDFSEANEKKGFSILDTDTWDLQFHEITSTPKFYSFPSSYDFLIKKHEIRGEMDFVRVRCTKEEAEVIRQYVDNLQVVPLIPEIRRVQRIKEGTSDTDLLREYIKLNKGVLDEERLYELGVGFLTGD